MTDWRTAVLNERGERLAVFDDPHAAYSWAVAQGFTEVYAEETLRRHARNPLAGWWSRRPNPLGEQGPQKSWEGIGRLRVEWSEVERLTIEDAYKRLMNLRMPRVVRGALSEKRERVWPLTKRRAGGAVEIACWTDPEEASKALLRSNDKLTKGHPVHLGRATGLSLLPAHQARMRLSGRISGIDEPTNLCVGSNEECRTSCLVFDGRNATDPHNVRIKLAKTASLFADPVAFCRLLYESCWLWLGTWGRRGAGPRQPFVRLNTYSDIPWELVFPELFTRLPDLMFYDYTKVPARPEMCEEVQSGAALHAYPWPKNYDLTFSVSGTNDQDAHEEWRRGRRIAVVFNTDKHRVPQWYEPPFLPDLMPVVDGSQQDMRPVDPDSRALERAREKLGPWTFDMTEKQRKSRIDATTALAYELTFGKKAPRHYENFPERVPPIVGMVYKPPLKKAQKAEAEAAQEKGRKREVRSTTKRAFLVSVVEKGHMIIAPGCPKTVSFTSPVIPASCPGVLDLVGEEQECLAPAAKRRKRRARRSR